MRQKTEKSCWPWRNARERIRSRAFLSLLSGVGRLLDDVAGGVAELDGGEVEFLKAGLDLGAVADGDDDQVVGVDVGAGGGCDLVGGDGAVGLGEPGVVGEGPVVEEDGGHGGGDGGGGLELAGQRLDASDLCLLHFGFGGWVGLDALELEH